ncbi:unnamed protein product [Closterium sp. Naga37s-1]|nr:unnamed protein product [Closterium sp. Naga37s-1]
MLARLSASLQGLLASVVGGGERVIWLPTGCLHLLEAIYTARPHATVIAADFSLLPDVRIPGANAPLVAAKLTHATVTAADFSLLPDVQIPGANTPLVAAKLAANTMAAEYPPPESNPPYAGGPPPTDYAPPPAYPPTGANAPPPAGYVDVEAGGGAGKPPAATGGGSGGASRMSTFIGIGLRIAELLFCMISFSLLVSTKYDYTKLSSGAFLLAMTIIGFILSFFLLVILVASLFVSALRPFQVKLRLFQVVENWLLSLLLFAAACTAGAQASGCVNTEGGTYWGVHIPGNNDCGLVKGSVAMAFLASFAYIGGLWYYALISYRRR